MQKESLHKAREPAQVSRIPLPKATRKRSQGTHLLLVLPTQAALCRKPPLYTQYLPHFRPGIVTAPSYECCKPRRVYLYRWSRCCVTRYHALLVVG